jgi:hypothetical protein
VVGEDDFAQERFQRFLVGLVYNDPSTAIERHEVSLDVYVCGRWW